MVASTTLRISFAVVAPGVLSELIPQSPHSIERGGELGWGARGLFGETPGNIRAHQLFSGVPQTLQSTAGVGESANEPHPHHNSAKPADKKLRGGRIGQTQCEVDKRGEKPFRATDQGAGGEHDQWSYLGDT